MRQTYAYDPAFGFRFIRGLKARIRHEGGGYLIRANEAGFRSDHPFEEERPPGTRRILLFGDSFTAGEGVSNGERYGDHLERLIPDLQIFNFGMPATGTDQHYLIYRECARNIEHDLLVIGVFIENIRRVASRYRHFHDEAGERVLYAKPYFTLDQGKLQLHHVPPAKLPVEEEALPDDDRAAIFTRERFPALKKALGALRQQPLFERAVISSGMLEGIQRMSGYKPITEYDDPNDPGWLTMRAILKEWIGEHDKPVVLVPIPLYHYAAGISDAASYQQRLSEATESAGGTFVDPLLTLKRRPQRRELYFEGDGHLTPKGHEALAECIAPSLENALAGGEA